MHVLQIPHPEDQIDRYCKPVGPQIVVLKETIDRIRITQTNNWDNYRRAYVRSTAPVLAVFPGNLLDLLTLHKRFEVYNVDAMSRPNDRRPVFHVAGPIIPWLKELGVKGSTARIMTVPEDEDHIPALKYGVLRSRDPRAKRSGRKRRQGDE